MSRYVPSQLGCRQTYTQKVAAAMNWYRRCVMGLTNLIGFQSGYFIRRAPEYAQMSNARKAQLDRIESRKENVKVAVQELLTAIEYFQTLPITLEDEKKGKLPKRRKPKEDAYS